MDTNKKDNKSIKKNSVVHITILVVVISLIVIAGLLATSNFDFINSVMKLHGG